MIVTLDQLDEEALVRILTQPKDAIVKQYQTLLRYDDVDLMFEEDALTEIAHQAMEKGTGARGLRSIIEKTLLDVMYELPSEEMIKQCTITKDSVASGERPMLGYEKRQKKKTHRSVQVDGDIA